MIDVIYMILRRLRVPLIILIAVYAISIFGLAIAPGMAEHNGYGLAFIRAVAVDGTLMKTADRVPKPGP